MNRFFALFLLLALLPLRNCSAQALPVTQQWGDWQTWGDLGNGTYRNPILPGDFSDIDCIRVGKVYYAISSTFQYSPGMVILQSNDLVNWTIAGHAINDLTQLSSELNWDRMNRYGRGVWAGSIRYHDKKFWVYFGTPDEGYFMTSAAKIEGPWAPVHAVLAAKGWDDCCPFWDDDGQGYLIGSNFADGYKIHLFQLSADGRDLVPGFDRVIYQAKGSEANKLYKINGWYYHFFSEVKSDGRAVMMERSTHIFGPYTEVKQLSHSQKAANEPNQGGLVETPAGNWYFLTHHGTGDWSGRNMSLLPVTWVNGWPLPGEIGRDTIGNMTWSGKIPVKAAATVKRKMIDEFSSTKLQPSWEWNYQPRSDKWSLTERKGWLRLYAFQPIEPGNLLKSGNTLTQRSMRTVASKVVVKLDLKGMADGQQTGLTHFGSPNNSAIGVQCTGSSKTLIFRVKNSVVNGPLLTGNLIWLSTTWGLDGKSHYSYSTDGLTFLEFGEPYALAWGSYRGDRLGVYNFNDKTDSGYTDIDYFHYNY